jgi:branched-chain amino acid aminotransferase
MTAQNEYDYYLFNHQFYTHSEPIITGFNRGLTLGDGVFETIKITHQHPQLWEHHFNRLKHSCSMMKLECSNDLYEQSLGLIKKNNAVDAVLKIIIIRHSKHRGLVIDNYKHSDVILTLSPLPPVKKLFKAIISPIRRNETSPLSRIKSTNYGDNILALDDATQKGYDNALMLNFKNQPCCFTNGNIVIETQNGTLLTPPPEAGCLDGTFLKTMPNLKYANFLLDDAVKIWCSNAILGLVPVHLDF